MQEKRNQNYYIFKHKLASGEVRDVEIYQSKLFLDNKEVFSIIVHDITDRVQAEDALRMKTGELETLFSISKHLRAARSADEMLPLVAKEMRNVLKADTSAIILLDQMERISDMLLGMACLRPT